MAPNARGGSLPYGFEAAGELLDLRLQRQELRRWALCEAPPEVDHLFASLLLNLNRDVDRLADELAHAHEILLHEAPRGHRRRPQAEAVRIHGALVARDRVLVGHQRDHVGDELRLVPVHPLRPQVHEDEVVVGAAGDEVEAAGPERVAQRLRVPHHLLLVGAELRRGPLLQSHGQGGDRVVVGAALEAREDRPVDPRLEVPHDRVPLLVLP